MRDPIAIEWRRNLMQPFVMLALAGAAGFAVASGGGGESFFLTIAGADALGRWIASPDREATDDFFLVRGIATRRGLTLRRLGLGLVPIALALGVAAVLRAAGRAEPGPSLALLGLAALDVHLIVSALSRAVRPRSTNAQAGLMVGLCALVLPITFAIAMGHGEAVLAIATLAGAPLALASLLRARTDERSDRRSPLPPRTRSELADRAPSRPLAALVRMALRPATGGDLTATLLVFGALFVSFAAHALGPPSTPDARLLSSWSFTAGLTIGLLYSLWAWIPVTAHALGPSAGRGQAEFLLARPLSRATLAAGLVAASLIALVVIIGAGFALATAIHASRGLPGPPFALAVGLGLLTSVQLGIGALAALRFSRTRSRKLARPALVLAGLALPLLLASPQLERNARGQSAVLAPWLFETAAPWIAAHVSLTLFGLLAASVLAHALAYRSFRSYEL